MTLGAISKRCTVKRSHLRSASEVPYPFSKLSQLLPVLDGESFYTELCPVAFTSISWEVAMEMRISPE
ncbi:MAG: hypothetical protein F6K28_31155 [Microcoleus sp. SIO2G3]|nr:hypothetical protein [Microcoleus sp. SIO2G3]